MQTTNRLRSERPRKKYDFYETPIELCKESLTRLFIDERLDFGGVYLDAGAGSGVWGKALYSCKDMGENVFSHYIIGVDIVKRDISVGYDSWKCVDFIDFEDSGVDMVFGNPPYSIAEEFVRKGMELVIDGGYVYFLLRLAFLESKKRINLFNKFPPKRVYVLQRRPSFFSANGKTRTTDATSYAMFLWQKGYEGKPELDWLYWDYDK